MTEYVWRADDGTVWDLANGPVFIMAGFEGFSNPQIERYTSDSAALDGQRFTGWRANAREVFLPLKVEGSSPTEWLLNQRAFWKSLRPGTGGTLEVTDILGATRTIALNYSGQSNASWDIDPTLLSYEKFSVTMIADDPWWRGPAVSATFGVAVDPVDFFNGGTAPTFYIMPSNTVASAAIANDGDVPAWPTVRVDGPASAFQVNGVAATVEVAAGEYLIVDESPTMQNAVLHTANGPVSQRLSSWGFEQVPAGGVTTFDAVLNGSGSLTITVTPQYFRAF